MTPGSSANGRPARAFDDPLAGRLQAWTDRAQALAAEGLPMPVAPVRELVEQLRARGDAEAAEQALVRAERLLERAAHDWSLLQGLIRRLEELKELSGQVGFDLGEFDRRIGDPRGLLRGARLSEGLIEQATGVASRGVAELNESLPRYLLGQGQSMGRVIQGAKSRGEDVTEATERMGHFVRSLRSGQLRGTATAYLELRRAVGQIPRAPSVGMPRGDEEEEILREARNLARRVNRMKTRARDAAGAARLMGQVRAALSEERRFASPEEEIEELWNEVDRLTRERMEAGSPAPAARPAEPELDPTGIPPELLEAANAPLDPSPGSRRGRRAREPPRP
jgi:HAMP domain-containing protein